MRKNTKKYLEEDFEYISFIELEKLAFCLKCNSTLSNCTNYRSHLNDDKIIISYKKIEEAIDEF